MTEITESELVSELSEEISKDTSNPPGDEYKLADYLESRLTSTSINFEIESYDVEPDRPNLVARAGDASKGSILLTGHMDVVPATAEDWTGNPFELRRDGDQLVGRGVSDMKGALAAKVVAAEAYLTETDAPGEIILAFMMDEERGGTGTEELADRGLEADGAIIGEPTELNAATAEYGVVGYTLTVQGQSSHSGRPDKGKNAIDMLRQVLNEIEVLAAEVAEEDHSLLKPGPSVSVTQIEGGIAPNIIPDEATAEVFWRTLPGTGDDPAAYDEQLDDAISRARFDGEPVDVDVDRWLFFEGTSVESDHPFVEAVVDAANDAGLDTEQVGFNAASDARYLRHLDIPTVLLGPGSIENDAHTVDESINVNDLVATAETYKNILDRMLSH